MDTIYSWDSLHEKLKDKIDDINDELRNAGVYTNIGTGEIFYVDSGVGADTYTGTRPAWAFATINEAMESDHCNANDGDVVFVIQNHTEDAGTLNNDVAGVRLIGLGDGTDMPEITYNGTADEFILGAANILVHNFRFVAGVSAVVNGISVEAAADNCIISHCVFPEPTTTTFEFIDAIDVESGADNLTVVNCKYSNYGATGANTFIDLGNGVNLGTTLIGNRIFGEFAVAGIFSDTADLDTYLEDNTVVNRTAGQAAIEFTGNATGMAINNMMGANAVATGYNFGLMNTFGNRLSLGYDASGFTVPPEIGQECGISKAATATDDDLFDVSGGPIKITGFYGVVTTQIGATVTTLELQCDADAGSSYDFDFSTAVAITSDTAGQVYVFDGTVGESVLTPNTGLASSMVSWYCPEGMIEQNASTSGGTGAITWYMTYMPICTAVSVTAQ